MNFGSPALLFFFAFGAQDGSSGTPVELLPHAELATALRSLAESHPDLVTHVEIGRSREGRSLDVLRFAGGDVEDGRPAILLVANLDGPRLFASGVALHHARRLAAGYGSDERVTALLDTTTVLVLARANPDAAEARFASPRLERVAGGRGVDNDRDGRQGEDPPSDVNGDGRITSMRVPDPEGTWIEDPTEPRALIEADTNKGQRGRWKLHTEGRDLDGDERVAEDPPGDTRVNRNFASGWGEHEADAGLFPTDEPEVRALKDFVIQHDELAMVVAYDELDDLVKEPKSVKDDAPSVKRVPPAGWLESDAEVLAELGRRYTEATGSEAEGGASDAGTFQRWCYDHRGLFTLSATLWELPQEDPEAEEDESEEGEETGETEEPEKKKDAPKPSDDARRLAWIDQHEGEGWRFVDWTPFEHPELGAVEIGGFAPYARVEPPEPERGAIADAHFDFLLGLGETLPRVAIAECTAERLSAGAGGVWRVEAAVENTALLPLQSRSAQRTRTVRPARVLLRLPEAGSLLAGDERTLVSTLPGSGGRQELTWLVLGPEGMEIGVSVDTDNAGGDRKVAEVVR